MGKLNSIKILGEGSITGGEYDKISVLGEGDAVGSFKCNNLKVTGECKFREQAEIEYGKILGEVTAEKKVVSSDTIDILGEFTAVDECKVNKLNVLGQGNFRNNLFFNEMSIKGEVNVESDCEGNIVKSEGGINVNGLLSAEKIGIIPKGVCRINEIGCSELEIRKRTWSLFSRGRVICKSIEADTITLENTNCKIVRGKDIVILGGCTIDKIEYTGTLSVDSESKVGEKVCLKN